MSNSALARALANRNGRSLEAWMPPAPTQGPAPRFLEASMPPAPPQGVAPIFPRGGWGTPEGYVNNSMPPITPMMAALARPASAGPAGTAMPPSIPTETAPVSMEMQGVPAFAQSAPIARNELERDYYRQLAQDPGVASWLARNVG